MRKTIMLGAVIALFSAGALAHARDVTTTEPEAATEMLRPAARGQDDAHERHEYRSRHGHHEARHGSREVHDEAHERHHESREHGRRY